MRKTYLACELKKKIPCLMGKWLISVGTMSTSKYKRVFEEEPGGCGQYRREVMCLCSLRDEPAFAWRKDEGERGPFKEIQPPNTVMLARSSQRFLLAEELSVPLRLLFIH